MKKGKIVFVFLLCFIFSVSLVYACAEDQIILRLSSETNAHGAIYSDTDYPIEICYDEIFGAPYAGTNPHGCTGSNKVLGLSGDANAHAENPSLTNYLTEVCYGDLRSCTLESSSCDEKTEIVRLSSDTNAHLAKRGSVEYNNLICCGDDISSETIDNVRWAKTDQSFTAVTQVDEDDTVYMRINGNLLIGTTITYSIFIRDFGSDTPIIEDVPYAVGINDINRGFVVIPWVASYPGAFVYFTAELGTQSEKSAILEIKEGVNDSPTVVAITHPINGEGYFVNGLISFEAIIEDEDSVIEEATWSFGANINSEGIVSDTKIFRDSTMHDSFVGFYLDINSKQITLEAKDDNDVITTDSISILIIPSTCEDPDDCRPLCEQGGKTWIEENIGVYQCCGDDFSEDNPYELTETSCDLKDNDCDGVIDENCPFDPCPGPDDCIEKCEFNWIEENLGPYRCCGDDFLEDSPYETAESACDGQDNDCDGLLDEGCSCTIGTRNCRTNLGACSFGTQTCTGGIWGATCVGGIIPIEEICGNSIDDDCDGLTDESCPGCGPTTTRICGIDIGECSFGTLTCTDDIWDETCVGGQGPIEEICDDTKDNDCDGVIDENCNFVGEIINQVFANISSPGQNAYFPAVRGIVRGSAEGSYVISADTTSNFLVINCLFGYCPADMAMGSILVGNVDTAPGLDGTEDLEFTWNLSSGDHWMKNGTEENSVVFNNFFQSGSQQINLTLSYYEAGVFQDSSKITREFIVADHDGITCDHENVNWIYLDRIEDASKNCLIDEEVCCDYEDSCLLVDGANICVSDPDPAEGCERYEESGACDEDRHQEKWNLILEGNDLFGDVICSEENASNKYWDGDESYHLECECIWKIEEGANRCIGRAEMIPDSDIIIDDDDGLPSGNAKPSPCECFIEKDMGEDDCEDNELTYSWNAWVEWNADNYFESLGACEDAGGIGKCIEDSAILGKYRYDPLRDSLTCVEGENSVLCPTEVQLPFFNLINVVSIFVILIGFYGCLLLREK